VHGNPTLDMAEALAIVGLVSAIVQFVDSGNKIVERLNEFNSNVHGVPKTFEAIKVQLPLLIDTLHRTQEQASAGHVGVKTATALKPLIDSCSAEIKVLQVVLDKTLLLQESSSWQRRLLALRSLVHDKDVERCTAKLEGHIRLLTFYQSTNNSDSSNKLLTLQQTQDATSQQLCKPIFMVPFNRDETFIGGEDILDNIDQKLNPSRRRAVLTGIGGVGYNQITFMVLNSLTVDSKSLIATLTQLAENALKLKALWKDARNAPPEVASLLEDVEIVALLLKDVEKQRRTIDDENDTDALWQKCSLRWRKRSQP
jgi:hypothetical protein